MTSLGYELINVDKGYQSEAYPSIKNLKNPEGNGMRPHEEILAICAQQTDDPAKLGKCNEGDAYWKHKTATLEPPHWREGNENPRRRLTARLDGSWV